MCFSKTVSHWASILGHYQHVRPGATAQIQDKQEEMQCEGACLATLLTFFEKLSSMLSIVGKKKNLPEREQIECDLLQLAKVLFKT